jgi:starch phosphorylase
MRILLDMHRIAWDEAWSITRRTFSYTNHTLLPEALEKWPVELFERMLPRHMQIVYIINAAHLDAVRRSGAVSDEVLASLSLIEEKNGRAVKMGTLACVGSHKVNGVSALHSELMRRTVFHDIHALDPTRIVNKTNGVTFRRWLRQTNRGLTDLISDCVGVDVTDQPEALARFADCADDPSVRAGVESVRHDHKVALARIIRESVGIRVNPRAMFDVQIKRIHQYKRQLLNVLEAIALYEAISDNPSADWAPRVKVFAGKAAATYHVAKLIIRLANDVGVVVNADPIVRDLLKVVFLPNYNVSLAQKIVPAADLSEQISTAGMEASGTGNMKLGLNGALTIGTLDGANVEMLEAVGAENIVIFGLTAEEVAMRRRQGCDPAADIAASPRLASVLDLLASGRFSPEEPDRYAPLVWALRHDDRFLVAADFEAYWAAQRSIDVRSRDNAAWWRSSILNTARMGYFSSDRTIAEYASEIWNVPVPSRR